MMGHNPASLFYWNDYLKDTRGLSPAAKGIWMDMLCFLHFSPTRGLLSLPVTVWAQKVGSTPEQFLAAVEELRINQTSPVTVAHKKVTVKSRRMLKEEKLRRSNAIRQARYKRSRHGNGEVTFPSSSSPNPKTDSLLQSSEERDINYLSSSERTVTDRSRPKPPASISKQIDDKIRALKAEAAEGRKEDS